MYLKECCTLLIKQLFLNIEKMSTVQYHVNYSLLETSCFIVTSIVCLKKFIKFIEIKKITHGK